jgi:mannose/fructose/N-acetylgalactosamine-specific phosphotransferase system component IIC
MARLGRMIAAMWKIIAVVILVVWSLVQGWNDTWIPFWVAIFCLVLGNFISVLIGDAEEGVFAVGKLYKQSARERGNRR